MFSITDEGKNKHYVFPIPELESKSYGKGINSVLSMIFYYLKYFVGKTKKLVLFSDNASGTNKNNQMLQFVDWLVKDYKLCE